MVESFLGGIAGMGTALDVKAWAQNMGVRAVMARWKEERPELFARVKGAVDAAMTNGGLE